ncbi:hypothetical protein L9F63_001340 [Diploptera punctata]|uniref:Uncharacterized protein n=1 Tax=Diploptera punctata TaxID=6984 RepID=A0AAD8A5G9_DIPPU|nr:hypothetical protein L9F63_001340 [Diploptera punctata]
MFYLMFISCLFFTSAKLQGYLMTKCMLTICNDHLEHGSNIIVLMPNHIYLNQVSNVSDKENYKSEEFYLLKKLHDLLLFPMLINSPNTSLAENIKCTIRRPVYILILNNSKEDIFTVLHSYLDNLESMDCLNRRANFLISLFSARIKENFEELIGSIFVELRKWNIINIVVVMKHVLTANKTNELNTEILDLYSWFPYEKPGVCLELKHITKVNTCSNGILQHNMSLFISRISNNLHGCPITAAITYSPLSVEPKKITYGNGTEKMIFEDGWELKFWKIVVHSLNLSEVYVLSSWDFYENGSAGGLKGLIISHRADIGFGSWPLLWRNIEILDPTVAVLRNELVWLVPCAQAHARWTGIFKVFSTQVWLLGALVTSLSASILAYLAKNTDVVYASFHRCIMGFFAILLGISVDVIPKKTDLRILFFSWVIFGMCMNTVFQCFLTTFLIMPNYQPQINSIDELLNCGLEYGYDSIAEVLLMNSDDYRAAEIKRKHINVPEGNVSFTRVAYERDFCYLFSKPFIEYILANNFLDENGEPKICLMDEIFFGFINVFYMQKGHPLFEKINHKFMSILEAGVMNLIVKRDMEKQKLHAAVRGVHRFGDDYSSLNLNNVRGIFIIFIFGHLIAFISFASEIIYSQFLRKIKKYIYFI